MKQVWKKAASLAKRIGLVTGVIVFGAAHAAAQTLGQQVQSMAQEASTAGGFVGSTAMYVAALVCFVAGVWAIWQSRQPENRESGRLGMGIAGLVLTGLFVTGGVWINKAAQTTSGGGATISSQSGVVTFQ
jgi:putative Mn2+ efflux pump MntP